MNTEFARVHAQLDEATKGVSNFRAFQLGMTKDMNFVRGAIKTWSIIASFLITLSLGVIAHFVTKFEPVVDAILADYYTRHPAAHVITQSAGGETPVYAEARRHP